MIHQRLLQSRAWGLEHLDELAADAATANRGRRRGLPRLTSTIWTMPCPTATWPD